MGFDVQVEAHIPVFFVQVVFQFVDVPEAGPTHVGENNVESTEPDVCVVDDVANLVPDSQVRLDGSVVDLALLLRQRGDLFEFLHKLQGPFPVAAVVDDYADAVPGEETGSGGAETSAAGRD